MPILLSAVLIAFLSSCYGIPQGTSAESTVGELQLKASGAGIVRANPQKTTYRVRCEVCGFENADKTILTPSVRTPYVLDWMCPNCGHKQIIIIQSFTKQEKTPEK